MVVTLVVGLSLLAGCTTGAPSPTPPGPDGAVLRISAISSPAVDRSDFEGGPDPVPGLESAPPGPGLTGYLGQEVAWQKCGAGECTQLLAPLDYADPQGGALTLAVKRIPASAKPRLGSLFINPGGPGASGVDFVESFARGGLEQYDIVGWDPRGTGASTPVRCSDSATMDAFNELDASPDDQAEREALLRGVRQFAQDCWQHSGQILPHISTLDTVRDLDLLRRLLGDDKLNYLGYSYGTRIGATYAEMFGVSTGRLVLDAAVDITNDDQVVQAMGFDLALGNFAKWCAQDACALGTTDQEVLDTIRDLLDRLDSQPVPVKERELTQTLATTGIAALLYGGKSSWPQLVAAIQQTRKGNGEVMLMAADLLNSRNADGSYDPMAFAFPAISCVDDSQEEGVLAADRQWTKDQTKAPFFGKYFGPQYLCPLWGVRPAVPLELRGATAAPLLVIGGTGDNATPYQQAVTLAEQLKSAHLVTYEGEGHGTFGGKSACVDQIVIDYLVDGTLPKDGVRCR